MRRSGHFCLPKGDIVKQPIKKWLLCARICTRGGVGWDGVDGWVMKGWGGVLWVMKGWGGVGWGVSYRGGVGWVMKGWGRVGVSCRGGVGCCGS